jgi:hypothetical protein
MNWNSEFLKWKLGYQVKLRSNLIQLLYHLTGEEKKSLTQFTDSIANQLFLDLTINEQQKTTPISFAINRVHTYLQAIRMGLIPSEFEQFDEDLYTVMQSYGIWHAAMMVQLYPDNFYMSELKTEKSPEFEELIAGIESGGDVDELVQRYERSLNYYTQGRFYKLIKLKDRFLILMNGSKKSEVFYCIVNNQNTYSFWQKLIIPDILDFYYNEAFYQAKSDENEFITLFSWRKQESNEGEYLNYLTANIIRDSLIFKTNTWKRIPEINTHVNTDVYNLKYLILSKGLNQHISLFARYDTIDVYCIDYGKYNTALGNTYESNNKKNWKLWIKENGGIEYDPDPQYSYGSAANNFYKNFQYNSKNDNGQFMLWKDSNKNSYLSGGNMDQFLPFYLSNDDPPFTLFNKIVLDNKLPASFNSSIIKIGARNDGALYLIQPSIHIINDGILSAISFGGLTNTISRIYKVKENIKINEINEIIYLNKWYYFGEYENKFGFYDLEAIKNDQPFLILEMPEFCPKCKDKIRLNPNQIYHDLVNQYLDEFHLHMPLFIAGYLNENQRYEEAYNYLCRIYDPSNPTDTVDVIYPGFIAESPTSSNVDDFMKNPFDPIAAMQTYKNKYVELVLLKHAENLIDWGDALFLQDDPESVNRARALYELASNMLGIKKWFKNECEEEWLSLMDKLEEEGVETNSSGISANSSNVSSARSFYEKELKKQEFQILKEYSWKYFQENELRELNNKNLPFSWYLKQDIEIENTQEEEDFALQFVGIISGNNGFHTVSKSLELKPFCIPINPMLNQLLYRVESNLKKIQTNRNFAGLRRDMQLYATPVDPSRMVQLAANGELNSYQNPITSPPPIYRYSFLLERAKYLASLSKQLESQMLSAIGQEEQAKYTLFRAKQDINLERANVTLQGLRLNEAYDSRRSAFAQKSRVNYTKNHYDNLIEEGLIGWENAGMVAQVTAINYHFSASMAFGASAIQETAKSILTLGLFGNPGDAAANVFSSLASTSQATASLLQTKASYARREQEWKFQRNLAEKEMRIAQIGIDMANDRFNIVNQEKNISNLRLQNANDNVEFLNNQFGNTYLYAWMRKNLKNLYRQQLNMAISTAKTAQKALEFERQSSLDFIGYSYWIDDKQGLLGAEQLESDLERMEQYRLGSDVRKKEIEKTISLSNIAPSEFANFRKTGKLEFATLQSWFDRDFPGHYMRMIRDVNITVLGLIPPNEGIHATLSNPGNSWIVTNTAGTEPSLIYRLPESIALSKYINANGLFELRPDDKMLFPFEGSGVATSWTLDMTKGANRFDFNSIADVLLTIRYTAMDEWEYKNKVLEKLGWDNEGFVSTSSNRYFSIRNEFPDQWYYFHNPIEGITEDSLFFNPINTTQDSLMNIETPLKWFSMIANISKYDFVPNEENRRISKVTLAVQLSDKFNREEYQIPLKLQFYPEKGYKTASQNIRIDHTFKGTEYFNGYEPYGKWIIQLDTANMSIPTDVFIERQNRSSGIQDVSWIEDILLIIEYKAKVHYNR